MHTQIEEEIFYPALRSVSKEMEDMLDEGTTMILGHNRGSEVLISHLTGEWHAMPPAAAALLAESGGDWSIEGIIHPRELD